MSQEHQRLTRAPLDGMLFIVWGFPEVTQTFIHRELLHIEALGGEVQLLAGYRIARDDLEPGLAAIRDRATFLGPPALWAARGLAWGARHPRRFGDALRWMASLPHRTPQHRARATAMVLAAAAVADEVQARDVRYIHAHFAAYQTELAMALSRLTGIPYGVTFHAYGIWKDRNIIAEKVRGARVVLTCTDHNAAHLRLVSDASCSDRIHLVYHGLPLDQIPPPRPYPQAPRTRFFAIGRLVEKKGFRFLIDAAAELHAEGRDFEVVIIGDGPERAALERRIAENGLSKVVSLPGAIANDEVWRELERSHALVAPSVREADGNIDGIPNVVLEAMSQARPVIGSELSGIPEVVIPLETGLLTAPESAADLAAAMRQISDDRAGAARMGLAGRALIEERFDVRANMARQLALLEAAAAPR